MAMAAATLSSVTWKTHRLLGMLDSSGCSSSESSIVEGVLTDLKSMLLTIQSAALAAEEIGDAVQPWICKVKAVAYESEDILDDCEHELLLRQHQGTGQPEVGASMSISASSLHKISEILIRFEEIMMEQEALNLRERDVRMMPPYRTRPAFSPPDSIEPAFYSREDDIEKMVQLLLSPSQQCQGDQPFIVSVIGEAGVGKTTLCWLVFTDPRICEHFDVRIWASVSQQCYAMDCVSGYSSSREISYLPDLLQWELVNKDCLLVLDELDLQGKDVQFWNSISDHLKVGDIRCKVLLTTRDEEHLAKLMAAMPTKYRLGRLSEESSWSLFKFYAFHGRDPEAFLSLAATGREIARKCRGSPLAVKMMGASLHSEDASEEQWKNILRSIYWESKNGAEMSVAEFCFRRLSAHLRRCLIYCSLFPRGYPFTRDQLVRLWMAQDFVAPVEGKRMEDAANGVIDELLWWSFLDHPQVGEQNLVMQGLIHDLAESLLADVYSREDDGRQICSISVDARHSSMLPHDACSKEIHLPSYSEPVYLRSFLLVKRWGHAGDGFYLPEEDLFRLQIPDGFFLPLGHLKALDLSYSNLEELPESIGMLKHLRYLSLSYTRITKLPASVVNLHSLQTLELRSCRRLYMLPGGIKKLTNLRHLDWFNQRTSWSPLPDIGELTNLQTLPSFVVARRGGHSCSASTITQLKQLVDLRGELSIAGLCGILFSEDADEAKLSNKEHLEKLTLEWYGMYSYHMPIHCNIDEEKKVEEIDSDEGACSEDTEEGGEMADEERWLFNMGKLALEETEKRGNVGCHHRQQHPRKPNRWYREEVLESLRPHTNLRHLVIDAYDGVTLPNWMGDPSFSSLVSLTLRGCFQCRSLPLGLGQLPSLKRLSIRFLGPNKQMQGRSPEPIVMKGFLSLEHLEVDQMPYWEEWCVIEDGNFPKMLQSLSISYCPRLKRLPQCLPALTKLQITRCAQLTGLPTAPSLLSLDIGFHGNPDEKVESWISWLEQLTTLQSLNISGIRDLSSTALQKHSALKRLVISHCQWNKRPHFLLGLHNLPALRRLEISACKELCFLPDERLPLTLKVLRITRCPMLREWCLQQRSKLAHISQITLDDERL